MGSALHGGSPAALFARPAADGIWLGPAQASALSLLSDPAPAAAVIGPPGSGRSLLLQRFRLDLAEADPAASVILLPSGLATDRAVLGECLRQTGINPVELGTIDRRNLFSVLVAERRTRGRRVLLIADDVDQLALPVIRELERLAVIPHGDGPAVELRLAARPGARLPWKARAIGLQPLGESEVTEYLRWRLGPHDLDQRFTPTAIKLLIRFSGGAFRALDTLCRMALLIAAREQHDRCDVRIIDAATRALRAARSHNGRAAPAESNDGATAKSGRLIVSEHGEPRQIMDLGRNLLIGRSESNDVCLDGCAVSRYHAALLGRADGRVEVADLNSSNGVWLNGERVTTAMLRDNDVLTIGEYKLKIELGDRSVPSRGEALPDTVVMAPQPGSRHLRIVR